MHAAISDTLHTSTARRPTVAPLLMMTLGVGDAPVYFLTAFAAMWPILLNTATGVARLDPNWLRATGWPTTS